MQGRRLLPVDVNGTAGFGNYHKVGPNRWEPWAIQVIEVADGQIVGHHNFLGAELRRLRPAALPRGLTHGSRAGRERRARHRAR